MHWQQIMIDCLTQIGKINLKWKVPTQFTTAIQAQQMAWVSNEQSPPIPEAATNQDLSIALHLQTYGFSKDFSLQIFRKQCMEKTKTHEVHLNKYLQNNPMHMGLRI
jgi:hypothetical protein